ncbi:MAG: TetR/AcrR family transcriptional regulator [Candidatus Eremiobacteraeota bacterium]|nr:TetR/AcrR family transcriptional regulator [Candidatus Eremiobacteraeota bacterium]
MVAERGITGAAMDEIALRSGVSKATIYGRWPSKDALCLEAIRVLQTALPIYRSSNPRDDCVKMLSDYLAIHERIVPRILAEISDNAQVAELFDSNIIKPRRDLCEDIVQRAIVGRQLRAQTDVQLAVDLLIGPVFYRRLISGASTPDKALPHRIVDAVWSAFQAP